MGVIKNSDEVAEKLNGFLSLAFIMRDNEEISIPMALSILMKSGALTEIEHSMEEIMEQLEKCKGSKSPSYGFYSNVLEEMNYATAELERSDIT